MSQCRIIKELWYFLAEPTAHQLLGWLNELDDGLPMCPIRKQGLTEDGNRVSWNIFMILLIFDFYSVVDTLRIKLPAIELSLRSYIFPCVSIEKLMCL